jgi:hypothetical protein
MLVHNTCRLVLLGLALGAAGAPAQALTAKECSVKYKAAQQAGTLGDMKWNDFRKAECGGDAVVQPAAGTTANPLKPSGSTPPMSTPSVMGEAMFPKAVSPKYASEKAGTARMHTCRDQYQANKASGSNGGLPWIKKGGGYYSECNKRLKGA